MDLYEEFVEVYIGLKEYFFIPQAHIKKDLEGNLWDAWLDFVALDFEKERIYLIEVTKSWNCELPLSRISPNDHQIIEAYVQSQLLRNKLPHFKVDDLVKSLFC